jgi:hypothetical protein
VHRKIVLDKKKQFNHQANNFKRYYAKVEMAFLQNFIKILLFSFLRNDQCQCQAGVDYEWLLEVFDKMLYK